MPLESLHVWQITDACAPSRWRWCSRRYPLPMRSPIASSVRASFPPRSPPTIRAWPMSCRCRPYRGRGRPTCRRPPNGTCPANCRNASPRISAFRSVPPGRKSAAPAARPWLASTTSRPRRNISSSKTARTNWRMLVGLVIDWGSHRRRQFRHRHALQRAHPDVLFRQRFWRPARRAGWLRAFAVTGQIGYQVPSRSFDIVDGSFIPQVLAWGGSIQYSMPYLKSEIQDLQLPDFINHLIPIVEFQMSTPAANNFGNSFVTTGTINPGVIWVGSYFQVGLEAQVPVNRPERARHRRARAIASLSRRHVPEDDRPAAHRRHVEPAATDQVLRYRHAKIFRPRIAAPRRRSHPSRRAPMPSSITPVRWSAAPCPRRRMRSC